MPSNREAPRATLHKESTPELIFKTGSMNGISGRVDWPFRKDLLYMKSTPLVFLHPGNYGRGDNSWVPIGRGTELYQDSPVSEGLVKVSADTVSFQRRSLSCKPQVVSLLSSGVSEQVIRTRTLDLCV